MSRLSPEQKREKHAEYVKLWRARNIETVSAREKLWRENNPDKVRESEKRRREKHREVIAERKRDWYTRNADSVKTRVKKHHARRVASGESAATQRNWRARNPEKCAEYQRRWREKNRGLVVFYTIQRLKQVRRATPAWANLDAIKQIYRYAAELTEITGVQYSVDHIIPLQNAIVCGLHVETNLRVITLVENVKKNNRFKP